MTVRAAEVTDAAQNVKEHPSFTATGRVGLSGARQFVADFGEK